MFIYIVPSFSSVMPPYHVTQHVDKPWRYIVAVGCAGALWQQMIVAAERKHFLREKIHETCEWKNHQQFGNICSTFQPQCLRRRLNNVMAKQSESFAVFPCFSMLCALGILHNCLSWRSIWRHSSESTHGQTTVRCVTPGVQRWHRHWLRFLFDNI